MNTSSRKISCLILIFLFAISLVSSHGSSSRAKRIHFDHENQHHHNEHDHHHIHQSNTITVPQRWGYGLLAGLCVSLIGFGTALMIVCCKNLVSEAFFNTIIKFLFSLAFGSLLGDSMIHILPEVYMSGQGDFRMVGAIFIGSIVFFLIIERIFQSYDITHQHWHDSQSHSHTQKNQNGKQSLQKQQNSNNKVKINSQKKSFWENLKGKGAAGYLNLLGSLIHNFMDGLALGVAFATGDKKTFIPLFVAIIAHQIPREMGDVAILMTNEFNPTQTVLCNGVINLISLVGVVMGLRITELDDVTKNYVLVFVAGNFIFIAADIWRNLFRNKKWWKNMVELIGIGIGVGLMFWILELESEGGHNHEHSHGAHGKNQFQQF